MPDKSNESGIKYPHLLFDNIRSFLKINGSFIDELYKSEFKSALSRIIEKFNPEIEINNNDFINNFVNKELEKLTFEKQIKKILETSFDKNSMKKKIIASLPSDRLDKSELIDIINKTYESTKYQDELEKRQFKALFKDDLKFRNLKDIILNKAKHFPDFQSFKTTLVNCSYEEIFFTDELLGNIYNDILRDVPSKDEFSNIVKEKFQDLLVEKLVLIGFKKKEILKVYEIVKSHDTEKDRLEIEKLTFQKPLIVPPGLNSAVLHFEAHFAVSGDDPIMILGQTGVGKSMFLYLAKRLFKKQHQYDSTPPPIVEANCAHFTGSGSGYSLARSELFGHVKGAFTDAHDDKKGLVEKADGGLLILEEVGELPKEVQAMLLTFIETGEYRKLGSEKLETANVKVVAATNRESALRDDFRYRFFPYYIPPLRERKDDILYYFHEIFPKLTKNFTKSEVLMLLAHHWPGNVREIERIGRLLNRERWINEQINKTDHDEQKAAPSDRLSHLDPRDTSFDPTLLDKFVDDLENWGVDISFLEKLLQKHRVSIKDEANQKAFEELSYKEGGWFSWFDEYALRFCEEYSPFNEAYEGYLLFCDLFLQDPAKDDNILATIKSQCTISEFSYMRYRFDGRPSYQRPLKNLRKKIMKYLMEVDGVDYDHIDNPWELWSILEQDKLESNKDYLGFEFNSEELKNAIAEMKEVDLLKLYYRKQLDKTGGNIKAAAKRIGMNVGTFTNRLKKLKMK